MVKGNVLTKLKKQERESRKILILDAAEQVFSKISFDKIRMQDISKEAGIAIGSIYTYFPNKEVLFVELISRESIKLISQIDFIIEKNRDSTIDEVIQVFIDYITNNDMYFKTVVYFMISGNRSFNNESLKMVNSVVSHILKAFDDIFERINYKGNTRLLSHGLFSALSGILIAYRFYPGRSEAEILRHMRRIGKLFKEMITLYITEKGNRK